MRSSVGVIACVGLALLTGACDPLDQRYLREGIGTELYTPELPSNTALQDLYVAHLCRQAGITVAPGVEPVPLCDDTTVGPRGWALVVQAGMNDIDQRCDAYLTWLDYRKRRSGAILQQIQDTTTATNLIMHATGTAPQSITIVGAAFGLAAHTFTNLHSRLLLEVNQSTVQSIVFRRQQDYRRDMLQRTSAIDNRPIAIHALRSYLRLCMPITIETEINTSVTLLERSDGTVMRRPLVSPQTVARLTIPDARKPLPAEGFRVPDVDPENLFIRQVQASLCVPNRDGVRGPATEDAIRDYLVGTQDVDPSTTSVSISREFRVVLDRALRRVPNCERAGFLTAFEVGRYGIESKAQREAAIVSLQSGLRTKLNRTEDALPSTGRLDDRTRQAITDFRMANNVKPDRRGQVDAELVARVRSGL